MNQHQREHEHSHWRKIVRQLNFYRVHNIFLYGFDISGVFNLIGSCRSAFTPLCVSIIFYVCNGRYKISYIDSLFNCFSAMTVCGLATIDLGALTGFQQALLFIQMCIGNPVSGIQNTFPLLYIQTSFIILGLTQVIISWVMVIIRKYASSLVRQQHTQIIGTDFFLRKDLKVCFERPSQRKPGTLSRRRGTGHIGLLSGSSLEGEELWNVVLRSAKLLLNQI